MTDVQTSRPATWFLPATLAVAMALAAPIIHAQTTSPPQRALRAPAMLQELQSIGATAAQQTQIQAILAQARSDISQQRKAAGPVRQQLNQVLAAANVDATAAEAARQKILAQKDASSLRMLQARLQIAAVLTPDQRQKLLALNEQQHAKWQGRHHPATGA